MIWIPALCAGVVSFLALPLVRPFLRRAQVIDDPNERSSHNTRTLRGGGIAPLIGFLLGAVGVMSLQGILNIEVLVITVTATLAAVLGLVEDLSELSILYRAGGQMVLGVSVALVLGLMSGATWWAILLAAVFFAAYVNVANFMDGLNGMSGLHGLAVGLIYAAYGVVAGVPWFTAMALVLAAAFLAFLPWNLGRPGIFLGDVGSYLLGAAIAAMAISAVFLGFGLIAALAPLAVYLADTGWTLVRRALRREPVLRSHRSHAYQRLTDTGFSHLAVSVVVATASLATGIVGVLSVQRVLNPVVALMLVGVIAITFTLLPVVRGHRLSPRLTMRLGPIESPPEPISIEPSTMMSWAVIGGSGFVGGALVSALRSRGYRIRAVPAPRVATTERYQPSVIADQAIQHEDLSSLAVSLEGVDLIVNAAGLATPDAAATDELYGANALLPAMVAQAAERSGAVRVVHLSSAAVQGNRGVLDSTLEAKPFSPYSHSKALGERAFLLSAHGRGVVLRATSVQGPDRATTRSLRRIARSPLASVGGTGDRPTVVSSIDGLVDNVIEVASARSAPSIVLQPWEGMTTAEVLRAAAGREPKHLPLVLCHVLLFCARAVGQVVPEIAGASRRLELMWLGQEQERPLPPNEESKIRLVQILHGVETAR